MLLAKIVETVPVTPEELYARWTDLDTYPRWSPDLEWVQVSQPVAVGSKGQIKSQNSRHPSPFRVTVMRQDANGVAFGDSSPLSLARLEYLRVARPVQGGAEVVITCEVNGIMSRYWGRALGDMASAGAMREDLQRLVDLIRSEGSPAPTVDATPA